MSDFVMSAETASTLMTALKEHGVDACVGGGWAVDALVGEQTRRHADLDVWIGVSDFESLLATFADLGIDRIYPWPGDRPWNFVLHDGRSSRVDLHLYEELTRGRLHYGSIRAPFLFTKHDLSGAGDIAGTSVRCERPEFALHNHAGYVWRDTDRHDVALLCARFGLQPPEHDRVSRPSR